MQSTKKTAFTLIELLIVIVIIGILAGVVLVVLNPATLMRRAQQGTAKALVQKACLAYTACYNASFDPATSAFRPAQCDTQNEAGLETNFVGTAASGIASNGGTSGLYYWNTAVVPSAFTLCNVTTATDPSCAPGWQDATDTTCTMYCDGATGDVQVAASCLVIDN